MQKDITKDNFIDRSIQEFKKIAVDFRDNKKCGKFAIEMSVFKGGFAGYKVKQEEDKRD